MRIVKAVTYTQNVLMQDREALLGAYPFLRSCSMGKSLGGRELPVIFWGEGDRRILLNGAHHGMEWITALLLMTLLEDCAKHYAERTAVGLTDFKALYSQVTLAFCPMVNPDGVNLAAYGISEDLPPITKTRLRSYNGESEDFSKWQANLRGVDLNHNYDAAFAKGVFHQHRLKIFSPGPTRYSGEYPESEPESKALADFTRDFLPHIAVAYHSQGEVIYVDFEGKATAESKAMASKMAELSGYFVDETDGMASYSGYKDWVIDKFRIPAFTIEVGLGENPLPLSQFEKIYRDNLPMLLCLMRS